VNPSHPSGFRLQALDFDKDVDAHMAVVAAISNLRAANYKIPEARSLFSCCFRDVVIDIGGG
jgi:hypothetical protein